MSEEETAEAQRAFEFDGNWREFLPIALTNMLLTMFTLGIYSFWAKARERRYLWGSTRFIDDRLEWTGTGMELFIGYVLVIGIFAVPTVGLQALGNYLFSHGHFEAALLLGASSFLGIVYLTGFAVFRALRYRLSRTFWHGIRGGSDSQGFGYALSHFWKTLLSMILPLILLWLMLTSLFFLVSYSAMGLFSWGRVFLSLFLALLALAAAALVPWVATSLWNQRWKTMSFGPTRFHANATPASLLLRYFAGVLFPVAMLIVLGVVAFLIGESRIASLKDLAPYLPVILVTAYLLYFVLLGLIALCYYAAYFREVIGALSLGELEFEFTARTLDWLKLAIVNIALVVFTFGIGMAFLGYRNWAFFIRYMHAYGDVDLDSLTQSQTKEPGQGEGLLDAFDVGAI